MRILWVEDDPEISKKTYFGSRILDFHDVQQIRDFDKAYVEVDYNLVLSGKYYPCWKHFQHPNC